MVACSGTLEKVETRLGGVVQNRHDYYFELVDHELFYWLPQTKGEADPLGVISLALCSKVVPTTSAESNLALQLSMLGDSQRQVVLVAKDQRSHGEWLAALSHQCAASVNVESLTTVPLETVTEGHLHVLDAPWEGTKKKAGNGSASSWSEIYARLYYDRIDFSLHENAKTCYSLGLTADFYVGDSRAHNTGFVVSNFDVTMRFHASHDEEKASWMAAVANVICFLGTIDQHQERVVESTLFQDVKSMRKHVERRPKRDNSKQSLHALVRQASDRDGLDSWVSTRAEKQRKMDRANAEFRKLTEKKRTAQRYRIDLEQEKQKTDIAMAKQRQRKLKAERNAAELKAADARDFAIDNARRDVAALLKGLEEKLLVSIREDVQRSAEEGKHREASLKLQKEQAKRDALRKQEELRAKQAAEEEQRAREKKAKQDEKAKQEAKKKATKTKSLIWSPKSTKSKKAAAAPPPAPTPTQTARSAPSETSTSKKAHTPSLMKAFAKLPSQFSGSTNMSPTAQPTPAVPAKAPMVTTPSKSSAKPPKPIPGPKGPPVLESASNITSPPLPPKQSTPAAPGKVVKLSAGSSLLSKVKMWDTKVEQLQTFQVAETVKTSELAMKPGDEGYGTARPGTQTALRAEKAQQWVEKEIDKLMEVLNKIGTKNAEGKITVTFGELFVAYQDISDTLVGIMKSAKKRKLISYPGQMLFQGLHDNVVVTVN